MEQKTYCWFPNSSNSVGYNDVLCVHTNKTERREQVNGRQKCCHTGRVQRAWDGTIGACVAAVLFQIVSRSLEVVIWVVEYIAFLKLCVILECFNVCKTRKTES